MLLIVAFLTNIAIISETDSRAGELVRLPGGERRGPRDSLVTAVPAPVCHRERLSRRLADVNVSSA